jgi:hypothetical protein
VSRDTEATPRLTLDDTLLIVFESPCVPCLTCTAPRLPSFHTKAHTHTQTHTRTRIRTPAHATHMQRTHAHAHTHKHTQTIASPLSVAGSGEEVKAV